MPAPAFDRDSDGLRIVEDRRRLQEQLAWQAVAIFFVAEAALLTVILSAEGPKTARLIASAAAAAATFVVGHLYARARYYERIFSEWVNARASLAPETLKNEAFPDGAPSEFWNRWKWLRWFTVCLPVRRVVGTALVVTLILNASLFVATAAGWSV